MATTEEKQKPGNPKWQPGQSGNPATQFKPGQSGNPSGRPKSPGMDILKLALTDEEKNKGKHLIGNIVRRAYESDTLAKAILNKLIPDISYTEMDHNVNLTVIVTDFSKADADQENGPEPEEKMIEE